MEFKRLWLLLQPANLKVYICPSMAAHTAQQMALSTSHPADSIYSNLNQRSQIDLYNKLFPAKLNS
eukprot:scaffold277421_cov19-Prasinocladus_malaysianus.AAC.1